MRASDEGDPLLTLVDAAQTPPFLTEHRVVLGRMTEKRERNDLVQPLVDYLVDPLPSTLLVLEWRAGRVPKALLEAVVRVGGAQVDTSPGRKVSEWVTEHLAEAGLKVDSEGRTRLVTWVGDEPSRLLGLIDLLRSTYGTRAKISAAEIEPFLGDDGGVPPWDLTDAIDRGDRATALELLAAHDRTGRAPSVPGAQHPALALRADAPARRRGRRRREGGRRSARHEGLHLPGPEGHGSGPPARARAHRAVRRPSRPAPISTCAAARRGRTTSCWRCSWPAWPRCRGDLLIWEQRQR